MDNQNQRCVPYPKDGRVKAKPPLKKIRRQEEWIEEEDPESDYQNKPLNPTALLPKVVWRDATDFLDDCKNKCKLPLCIWLGK
mmetsp:Transcript_22554/g.56395  ORF Transcript_22554/g.56395 Transcript_22554/m.56395 type:complete len:83 (+) Transcript_22554:257-505(+)